MKVVEVVSVVVVEPSAFCWTSVVFSVVDDWAWAIWIAAAARIGVMMLVGFMVLSGVWIA
ncbi:MAG: hypothetical protein EOP88_05640 [Verrucomicrobiaceae bacterium]|nr:MAG: hypothetical protein EOP88_05640 [Verrucomicrobiaceae bacterium]